MQRFIALAGSQLDNSSWLGEKYSSGFAPFAQKLEVAPDAEIALYGDMHGDVHSPTQQLTLLYNRGWIDDHFNIVRKNFYMIFLGDYVDRGYHGAEVIYTLLRLKLANPERVFMIRGNHEDVDIQARDGFGFECNFKFEQGFHREIGKIYNLIPVVLYLGCGNNFAQCCHGGMEPGYNPTELLNSKHTCNLLGKMKRSKCVCGEISGVTKYYTDFTPTSLMQPYNLGFAWSDFELDPQLTGVTCRKGRGLIFTKGATQNLLTQQNTGAKTVSFVFRAHQHIPSPTDLMMQRLVENQGVYSLWQPSETTLEPESRIIPRGSVWTLNVAPDSIYGMECKFDFSALAIITVAAEVDSWRLRVLHTNLNKILPFIAKPELPSKPVEVDDESPLSASSAAASASSSVVKPILVAPPLPAKPDPKALISDEAIQKRVRRSEEDSS